TGVGCGAAGSKPSRTSGPSGIEAASIPSADISPATTRHHAISVPSRGIGSVDRELDTARGAHESEQSAYASDQRAEPERRAPSLQVPLTTRARSPEGGRS